MAVYTGHLMDDYKQLFSSSEDKIRRHRRRRCTLLCCARLRLCIISWIQTNNDVARFGRNRSIASYVHVVAQGRQHPGAPPHRRASESVGG